MATSTRKAAFYTSFSNVDRLFSVCSSHISTQNKIKRTCESNVSACNDAHTFSRANFFVYECLIFFYLIVWRWAYLPTYNVLTTRYENTSSPPSAIMPVRFGDFQPLCTNTPSYPWCNLFYRQLLRSSLDTLTGLSIPTSSAPVGVNPSCGIPRVGHDLSLANIANIAACGVSVFFVGFLIFLCHGRKAAVGRVELRTFLILYLITLPLQLVTTGSFLEQGSEGLVIVTAIHAGAVLATFWSLLANAIVATQVVEDGSMSSIVPLSIVAFISFGVTVYISLDIGLGITTLIGGVSNPPEALRSIALFILTSILPAVAALLYLVIMSYIVLQVLEETRPMWYYILATCLFVLSQLAWFLLGRVICKGSNSRVDGSFVATLLETAAVGVLFLGWKSITEESWDDYP